MKQPSATICIITNSGLPDRKMRIPMLQRLLKSIPQAGFPDDTEIIVGGAVPDAVDRVAQVIELADWARNGNVSHLRNVLAAQAKGTWIIQCDDDILFSPGYWDAIVSMKDDQWDILCTRLLNPNGTRYWDWAAYVPGRGQTLVPYDAPNPDAYATGGHAVFRRHVLESIKWNTAIRHGGNEEFSFAEEAKRRKFRYVVCPNATVFLQYHHCDAASVILGQQQIGTDRYCRDFQNLITPGSITFERHQFDKDEEHLLRRVRHKLVGLSAGQSETGTDVSIITCCYRYRQRFKVFADALGRQDFDLSRVEIIVSNPQSPDGLSSCIQSLAEAFARSKAAGPRIREIMLDESHRSNRGLMIQRAFGASCGRVVIGMDCDIVVPENFLSVIFDQLILKPKAVIGVYRNFLSAETTNRILAGSINPHNEFNSLLAEDFQEEHGYRGVLGYCQAVRREAWESVRYPEHHNEISKSDVEFIDRLGKIDVHPLFLKTLRVLHLQHARDWSGTKEFL